MEWTPCQGLSRIRWRFNKDAIQRCHRSQLIICDVLDRDDGTYIFVLEGKTYRIKDKDEVRSIAEQHGYIIIY